MGKDVGKKKIENFRHEIMSLRKRTKIFLFTYQKTIINYIRRRMDEICKKWTDMHRERIRS